MAKEKSLDEDMYLYTYDKSLEERKEELLDMVMEENAVYEYKIDNEHDKLFKDLLSDSEETRKFINKFLKLEVPIKENELELYNSSYITTEYKSKEADVVYKKKNEDIYFLIEHQSTVDISMPYRIKNYVIEILRIAVDKSKIHQKEYKYPLVVPIVLYTGNKKWNVNFKFEDMQTQLPRI